MTRRLIALDWLSADGYFADAEGSLDWVYQDQEVEDARHEIGADADTILFGGTTYRIFESMWPRMAKNPDAPEHAKELAEMLTNMRKLVVSKSIKKLDWENSELLEGDLLDGVRSLKQEEGGSIIMFGSGEITKQLADEGLVDQYVFAVCPVVLGDGKSLFKGANRFGFRLLETRTFKSGNVLFHYETDK